MRWVRDHRSSHQRCPHGKARSLSPTPLTLQTSPQSAQDARRWAAASCLELGRPDLISSAQLAVSELVTNALLHASPPIALSVHGTREHPRFEVSDGSATPPIPSPRPAPDDLGEGLSTIGRGLTLVAMSSTAWGAYIHSGGKTVWFEPAVGLIEHPTFLGEIHEGPLAPPSPPSDAVTVHLLGFPTARYVEWRGHFRDLQRELRLLSLAHEQRYPMARELSDFLSTFSDRLRRWGSLTDPPGDIDGDGNLTVQVSPDIVGVLEQMTGVLELADAFCRQERMLTPPSSPGNVAFQSWLFGQAISQVAGADPVPWHDVAGAPQP